LKLSYNQITGEIPESIRLLYKLEVLSLQWNSLEGNVTEAHLSNFSKLHYLSLSHNSLSLNFVSSWVPPFQLSYLALASCKLGPNFPSWLQTQNSLMWLDISDNGLNDFIPKWFWKKLQTMYELNICHNNLIGSIPNLQLKLAYRPSINLNSNKFEGKVPLFLLQASELLLSGNKFSDLFSFLCGNVKAENMATLDLSDNQINGELPDCWKSVNRLLFLDLSNNLLSGTQLQTSSTDTSNIDLSCNNFTGEIPKEIMYMHRLVSLNLSRNNLSGEIPSEIGNLKTLDSLDLSRNHLSGKIPPTLSNIDRLAMLDLSNNHLSGRIPWGRQLQTFDASSFEGNVDLWETA